MLFVKKLGKFDIEIVPVFLKNKEFPFFLDSGKKFGRLGRFCFFGYNPIFLVKFKNGSEPFKILKDYFYRFKINEKIEKKFPFHGGFVGYLTYELGKFIEKLPDTRVDDYNMPEIFFGFYDVIFVFDLNSKDLFLTGYDIGNNDFGKKIESFEKDIFNINNNYGPIEIGGDFESNFEKDEYLNAIEKARTYIYNGDIYQVNLSQRFRVKFKGDAYKFYSIFRKISPAPFGAFLDFGDFQILSNSPERYLYISGKHIETRPIKGTRKRGKTPIEDLKLIEELKNSEKDKAEHLMIVDLERNDLGRIAEFNSVKVSEFEIIETYANVHHMVSTVEAKIRDDKDCIDCIINSYPGGSITGAPKIRSMEIIDELEPTYRGVYTGSIGYIDLTGDIDFNIAIRTAILKDGYLNLQVGGGIVYDSVPEDEYMETIVKAESFFKTVRELI